MLDIPYYINNKYILNDLKIIVKKEVNTYSERYQKGYMITEIYLRLNY